MEVLKADKNCLRCLQLRRSSASTNVSILNLTEPDSFKFETCSSDLDDWAKSAESQDTMKNSGLKNIKDSDINLKKKKNSKLNQHVDGLKTDSAKLCDENLEQRALEVEMLEEICNTLEEKVSSITMKLEEINEKIKSLSNLTYEILKDMSSFQGLLQNVESRSETTLFRELNQYMVSMCRGIKELQDSLESHGHRAESDGEVDEEEITRLITAIVEIRNNVAQISVNSEITNIVLKNLQRTVFDMNTRIESFISQEGSAQEQQESGTDNIEELRFSM